MAPGADPNQRRDLNLAHPCGVSLMNNPLQAINPNAYMDGLQTYYSQKPGIVITRGVCMAVLLLLAVVMIPIGIKKRKAALGDHRHINVLSQSEILKTATQFLRLKTLS
ncbi:hypothetical protein DFS33DRAFT_1384595 [Desarmillaria ectypa]|nr:hypothetical protein DFS33DRAFT_1384595 [Desarmillaria ectypa]